jgi:hypothetical protein
MSFDLQPLSDLCLTHLAREEAALQAARAGLDQLHAAVVHGDAATFQAALQTAADLADETQKTHAARLSFCRALADALDLSPETITLSAIAARLPGHAGDQVAAARDRLQALSAEVRRLTARTASVVSYCRTFMRNLFADLTDTGAAANHYGPGPRATAAAGALLVARG